MQMSGGKHSGRKGEGEGGNGGYFRRLLASALKGEKQGDSSFSRGRC